MRWLSGEIPGIDPPSEKFSLDCVDTKDCGREAPDLIPEWMKRVYGYERAWSDGWDTVHAVWRGVMVIYDLRQFPDVVGYVRAMQIVQTELVRARPHDKYGVVSRAEMIQILEGWENPHDVADRIVHARELAS